MRELSVVLQCQQWVNVGAYEDIEIGRHTGQCTNPWARRVTLATLPDWAAAAPRAAWLNGSRLVSIHLDQLW